MSPTRIRALSRLALRHTLSSYRTMSYNLPPDSWDTHCHIFEPIRHPYVRDTPYAPPARTVGHLVQASECKNHVIVLSRPEGTNTDIRSKRSGRSSLWDGKAGERSYSTKEICQRPIREC